MSEDKARYATSATVKKKGDIGSFPTIFGVEVQFYSGAEIESGEINPKLEDICLAIRLLAQAVSELQIVDTLQISLRSYKRIDANPEKYSEPLRRRRKKKSAQAL